MRRVRYSVAVSLDGYIAGPQGEADWTLMDPDIDFESIFKQFDTILMGGRTYAGMAGKDGKVGATPGMKTYVFSKMLQQRDHPNVTIVADNVADVVNRLRGEDGKDIWLFGGGQLFR